MFFSVQESGSDLLSSRIGIWSGTLFQVFCLGIEVPEKIFFNKYLTWKSIILIWQCYIFRIRIRAKWSGSAGLVRMCYVLFSGAVSSIESMEGAVRTLGSKLVFPDTRTTILACCIIYFFRYRYNRNKISFLKNYTLCSVISCTQIYKKLLYYNIKSWNNFKLKVYKRYTLKSNIY